MKNLIHLALFAVAALLALSFALPVHAQPAACDWSNPGQDKYRGTATAAIMKMPGIPLDVRQALAKRAEANDYDDVVSITRTAIVGSHGYAPDLRHMAFGGKGKVCAEVTRAGWKPDHVETAMVFCERGHCVARPGPCNNWSALTRLAPAAIAPAPVAGPVMTGGGPSGGGYVNWGPYPAAPSFVAQSEILPAWVPAPVFWPEFWYPPVNVPIVPPPFVPPVTPPVPEPATWLMMIAGMLAVAAWRSYRKSIARKSWWNRK